MYNLDEFGEHVGVWAFHSKIWAMQLGEIGPGEALGILPRQLLRKELIGSEAEDRYDALGEEKGVIPFVTDVLR